MKTNQIETLLLVLLLVGTLFAGYKVMYQINTTDFQGITKQLTGVSK